MFGRTSMYALAGLAGARNVGRGIAGAATGKYGLGAAGALWGGGLGAAWGAVSGDTSVVGGALMGAGLGAFGGRYGGAGVSDMTRLSRSAARIGAPRPPLSVFARRGGGAAWGRMKGDALLVGNKASNGWNAIQSRGRGAMEGPMNAYGYMF